MFIDISTPWKINGERNLQKSPFFWKKQPSEPFKPPWLCLKQNVVNFLGESTTQTAVFDTVWKPVWESLGSGFIIHQHHGKFEDYRLRGLPEKGGPSLTSRFCEAMLGWLPRGSSWWIFRVNSYGNSNTGISRNLQEWLLVCIICWGWAVVIVAGFLSFRCIIIKRRYTLRMWRYTLHQKWWAFFHSVHNFISPTLQLTPEKLGVL